MDDENKLKENMLSILPRLEQLKNNHEELEAMKVKVQKMHESFNEDLYSLMSEMDQSGFFEQFMQFLPINLLALSMNKFKKAESFICLLIYKYFEYEHMNRFFGSTVVEWKKQTGFKFKPVLDELKERKILKVFNKSGVEHEYYKGEKYENIKDYIDEQFLN